MKIMIILSLVFFNFDALGEKQTKTAIIYNAELAEKLGADEYGMKMYVMAFLKKGPNRDQTNEVAQALQKAHMQNIQRMAKNGDLVLAGPFGENNIGMQGIYIFNVSTVAEAEALTATDPAIKAGRLVMELIPWYGSAAIMQVNEVGLTLAKKSF